MKAEEIDALDCLCRWIEAVESLHHSLKDIEKHKPALDAMFGAETIDLLQISTQGSIHRMLGSTPETERIRGILPRLDEAVAARRRAKTGGYDGRH